MKNKRREITLYTTRGALIASIYVVLTLLSSVLGLSSGVIWDVIFGSVATLIGAVGTRMLAKLPEKWKWAATVPTVISNMIIVPFVLIFAYGAPDSYPFLMLTVGIGEIVCAGFGGTGLYYLLKRTAARYFK